MRAVVLAAGKGTRMRSDLAKVLHPLLGRPLLGHVLAAVAKAGLGEPVVVVGHQAEAVMEAFQGRARFARQSEALGTADAVASALPLLPASGPVVILYGDMPLLTGDELADIARRYRAEGLDALVVAARVQDPTGYGRVLLGEDGGLLRIVEEKDATPEERRVELINTGVYVVEATLLARFLGRVGRENAQGEKYLPDLFTELARAGARVRVHTAPDATPYLGVNDRVDLARAAAVLRQRILEAWMRAGVTVEDPATTYVDADVHLGGDVVLRPGTHLLGRTTVGARTVVGPDSYLVDAAVGADCLVVASYVEASTVADRVRVGPFAHLRPGCVVEPDAEVGNFAELKNVRFGRGSKAHHHCYLGDAEVGAGVNIGAGAITVNYDGVAKHRTTVAAGAFIGCNANLIAPVTVGEEAYVAAGSTVNQDVPPRALAVARERQRNIEGWVDRRRRPRQEGGTSP